MRGGLLFVGILLLAVGAALYFIVPMADANTRYARDGVDDAVTMSVLPSIGIIAMLVGVLLALLGLVMPAPVRVVDEHEHVVERTRTVVKDARGKTKRVETHEIKHED